MDDLKKDSETNMAESNDKKLKAQRKSTVLATTLGHAPYLVKTFISGDVFGHKRLVPLRFLISDGREGLKAELVHINNLLEGTSKGIKTRSESERVQLRETEENIHKLLEHRAQLRHLQIGTSHYYGFEVVPKSLDRILATKRTQQKKLEKQAGKNAPQEVKTQLAEITAELDKITELIDNKRDRLEIDGVLYLWTKSPDKKKEPKLREWQIGCYTVKSLRLSNCANIMAGAAEAILAELFKDSLEAQSMMVSRSRSVKHMMSLNAVERGIHQGKHIGKLKHFIAEFYDLWDSSRPAPVEDSRKSGTTIFPVFPLTKGTEGNVNMMSTHDIQIFTEILEDQKRARSERGKLIAAKRKASKVEEEDEEEEDEEEEDDEIDDSISVMGGEGGSSLAIHDKYYQQLKQDSLLPNILTLYKIQTPEVSIRMEVRRFFNDLFNYLLRAFTEVLIGLMIAEKRVQVTTGMIRTTVDLFYTSHGWFECSGLYAKSLDSMNKVIKFYDTKSDHQKKMAEMRKANATTVDEGNAEPNDKPSDE